jgi:CheY-like chemotaxis protein
VAVGSYDKFASILATESQAPPLKSSMRIQATFPSILRRKCGYFVVVVFSLTTKNRGIRAMKERILLVGEDSNLIATRALLLSNWETETINAIQATEHIETHAFELLVICQTVSDMNARALIRAAKKLKVPPEILLIRADRSDDDFGVDVHSQDLWESPAWLRNSADELLKRRIAA